MKKVLILGSGGLDSTCLLYKAIKLVGGGNVHLLCMYYGQKHSIEMDMLRWHSNHMGVEYSLLQLDNIFRYNKDASALLIGSKKDIDHRSYADQLRDTEVVSAYVPYRNGLFLSVAASIAYQLGCDTIAYGAHADDAVRRENGEGTAAYPDCTETFIRMQRAAIWEGTGGKVNLWTPFMDMTKTEVVADGLKSGMTREEFEHTHSCYEGVRGGCHTCGTCRDREAALDAFEETRGCGQSGLPRNNDNG